LNIDSDSNCKPDFLVDLENDTLPFNDNSIDSIKAIHILEHIGTGYFHLMKELYRISNPLTIINITVPHHRHDFFLNDPTHKRPITIDGLKLFSKKYNQTCLDMGAAASTLGIMLDIDFEVFDYSYKFNPMYQDLVDKANSGVREAQLLMDQFISEKNNVIEETHIDLMVIK
jgi:ubiquinone/menaquinone biosynthesis C-methylase UbiE